MFGNEDFTNYMGYRNMVVEEKIEACLTAARRGETSINIDSGDLTDSEIEYLEKEVRSRIETGNY